MVIQNHSAFPRAPDSSITIPRTNMMLMIHVH